MILKTTNRKLFFSPFSPLYKFSIKTSQKTLIQPTQQPTENIFTREIFKFKQENPHFEQEQKEKAELEQKIAKEKYFFDKSANDKNPTNFIKVKVNSTLQQQISLIKQIQNDNHKEPFIIKKVQKPAQILCYGIRRNIPTTIKKLWPATNSIAKKHVYDAMSILEQNETKAARYVMFALKQVLRHAKQQGLEESRLYVQSVIIGKQKRFKLIYYHARGRHGNMKKEVSQVRLQIEEKPAKEMYKEMITGKAPPAIAFVTRKQILDKQKDYETLRKFTWITTAKGRQQQKLMLKREVMKRHMEFKKQGVIVPIKSINERIVEEKAQIWVEQYEASREVQVQTSINDRMALFKRNEEATA